MSITYFISLQQRISDFDHYVSGILQKLALKQLIL